VARLRFTAAVRTLESDSYGLTLEIGASPDASPDWWDETIGTATLRCRPQSLGEANFRAPISAGAAVQADFETVAFDKLTSFFVIEIGLARGALRKASTFIVNADLVGAPEDRLQRVLVKLFDNPRDFLRFLLLLLDHLPTDHPTGLVDVATGERASPGEAWKSIDHQAPFEPLVRALATELGRRRLDEIQGLVMKLEPTGASTDLLPANWQEIWKPIWLTREELCQR
jgi:hypothetical protein